MTSELVLWGALAVLIALLALAVWAGRRGLHALGVVGPGGRNRKQEETMAKLVDELSRLNGNLEAFVEREREVSPETTNRNMTSSDEQ